MLKLPESSRLGAGIIIPNWRRTREALVALAEALPPLEDDAPPNAQPWRRLCLGTPNSQMDGQPWRFAHPTIGLGTSPKTCSEDYQFLHGMLRLCRPGRLLGGISAMPACLQEFEGVSLLSILSREWDINGCTDRALCPHPGFTDHRESSDSSCMFRLLWNKAFTSVVERRLAIDRFVRLVASGPCFEYFSLALFSLLLQLWL